MYSTYINEKMYITYPYIFLFHVLLGIALRGDYEIISEMQLFLD